MQNELAHSFTKHAVADYVLQNVPLTTKHFVEFRLKTDQKVYAKCKISGCRFQIHYNKSTKNTFSWILSKKQSPHDHAEMQLISRHKVNTTLQAAKKRVVVSPSTGYCGFHAIAHRVFQDNYQHMQVKKDMLLTLEKNLEISKRMRYVVKPAFDGDLLTRK